VQVQESAETLNPAEATEGFPLPQIAQMALKPRLDIVQVLQIHA